MNKLFLHIIRQTKVFLELPTKKSQTELHDFAESYPTQEPEKPFTFLFLPSSLTTWALTSPLQEKLLFPTVKINKRPGIAL